MPMKKKTSSTRKPSTSRTSSKPRPKSASKRGSKESLKKYGATASKKVGKALHEQKEGTLKAGRSGKKVTSRKQAIAIGLSEARKEGGKVPRRTKE